MRLPVQARAMRFIVVAMLLFLIPQTLMILEKAPDAAQRQDRLYFPSGEFLVESSLGFREPMADYLWFRFIQYYGAFRKGENDLRYMELLTEGISRLDPKFVESYYLPSLILWSDFGKPDESIAILKKGILHNPDTAKLHFQIGFIYFVAMKEYSRASFWFASAAKCSDATDREKSFAAFSRYKAGHNVIALELYKTLLISTDSPQMQDLAIKMIKKLEASIAEQQSRSSRKLVKEPGF